MQNKKMQDVESGDRSPLHSTSEIENNDVFFQKVEVQIPRVFVRICSGIYKLAFNVVRIIGGDMELTELRTILLIWEVISYFWFFLSGFLLYYLDIIMHHKTSIAVDIDIPSYIDKLHSLIDRKRDFYLATNDMKNDATVETNKRIFIFLTTILNIVETQQERINGLKPSWEQHDFVVFFVVEMLWVIFFPYLLKFTVLPILRRVLIGHYREN